MKIFDYTMKGITPESERINPIVETDKDISIGDVLIINNIAYYICCMSGGKQCSTAYVKRIKEQKVFIDDREEAENKCYTNEITCPYCGYEDEDSWEAEEAEDEYECPCCGSVFAYQRIVTVEYCSQPVKKANAIVLN